ncbi:hypothetical protein [Undibacterium sp.]|uniref:hypothetical protein n=1 Tax=Undibacterium sp. TaxID=1914977 RepID=UPI0025F38E73|nr:hypothetical protein [Undibacterium sp.]
MSFTKDSIGSQSLDIGKSVLALSALGLFTKLLKIDLSKIQILGVTFGTDSSKLIPGFLGLALIYSFLAFIVARTEVSLDQEVNKDTVATRKAIAENKGAFYFALLISPLSLVVYSTPYAVGAVAIALLWGDSISILGLLWSVATQ